MVTRRSFANTGCHGLKALSSRGQVPSDATGRLRGMVRRSNKPPIILRVCGTKLQSPLRPGPALIPPLRCDTSTDAARSIRNCLTIALTHVNAPAWRPCQFANGGREQLWTETIFLRASSARSSSAVCFGTNGGFWSRRWPGRAMRCDQRCLRWPIYKPESKQIAADARRNDRSQSSRSSAIVWNVSTYTLNRNRTSCKRFEKKCSTKVR